MAVFIISQQARTAFTQGASGYEAVLGARGSQVQLVLNAVFHLETSPGNIPWSLYQRVSSWPGVERAVALEAVPVAGRQRSQLSRAQV